MGLMSNYLKYFKDEFEKYAQADIGAPPSRPSRKGGGGTTPSKPTGTTPGSGAGKGGIGGPPSRPSTSPKPRPTGGGPGYSTQGIKNMQAALHALAQTISATIDYDALLKTMSTPPGQPSPEDKGAFQAQYGRDMFSNFMVGNYLRRANVHGVEYDTDPKRTKMLDKKPSDLKSMFNILDSMRRIGSEKKESVADGNWGPRTNNALRNAAAIATAISKLGGDLGMESTAFDVNKIAELNSLVPENYNDIPITDKLQRAPKITEILKGANALFKDFKQQVFMDPTYRNFIEGKAPMMTFGPQKEKGIEATEGEKLILADLQQSGVRSRFVNHPDAVFSVDLDEKYTGKKVPPFQITTASLISPEAFEHWINGSTILMDIKKNNPGTWPSIVSDFLTQIEKQVGFLMVGGNQRK